MDPYSMQDYLQQAPVASLVLLLYIVSGRLVRLRRERAEHHAAAELRHAEMIALMITLRSPAAGRHPQQGAQNQEPCILLGPPRAKRPISTELLGVLRGVYDAQEAIRNPWTPDHDCPHCAARQADAGTAPTDHGATCSHR